MKKTLIAITLLAFLFLSACSSQVAVPTDNAVKAESSEIILGYLGPLSGGAASLGVPIKDAVVLAVDEINKNNLIPGKTLKIIYEDTQADPKKATTATQKLINIDKVLAIIGPAASGATLAIAPIVEDAKVLLVSYGSTNPSIKNSGDYIFRVVPSDSGQGIEAAKLVKKLGAKKVAIIHIQNDWATGLIDVFRKEAKNQGFEIVAEETYNPEDTDFRTQLSKIKETNPGLVYMLAYPGDAGLVLKQTREIGIDSQIVCGDAAKDEQVLEVGGVAAEGLISTIPGIPKSPELEKFAAAYKQKYGKDYGAYTAEAYDTTYIIAKACAATDCTSTAMKDYLYNMGSYHGASGTFEFDKDGEVQKAYDYFIVKEGKWEPYVVS